VRIQVSQYVQSQLLKLAHFLMPSESCNAPSQTEETLELPEPPNNANSGPVGLADVASNTQNEQSGEPVELSGGCEQLCKEERVPEHEQSLPVDKIEE
jgi:hypothetical protein